MAKLRVHSLAVSLDGYAAGPDQPSKTRWDAVASSCTCGRSSATYHRMDGDDGGSTGVDDGFAARGVDGIGATIMGRNMFGPVRGGWPDETWTGWWGDEPHRRRSAPGDGRGRRSGRPPRWWRLDRAAV